MRRSFKWFWMLISWACPASAISCYNMKVPLSSRVVNQWCVSWGWGFWSILNALLLVDCLLSSDWQSWSYRHIQMGGVTSTCCIVGFQGSCSPLKMHHHAFWVSQSLSHVVSGSICSDPLCSPAKSLLHWEQPVTSGQVGPAGQILQFLHEILYGLARCASTFSKSELKLLTSLFGVLGLPWSLLKSSFV